MGYDVEYQPFQVPDQYVGFIESPLSTKRNWQAGAAPNALISTEAVTAPLIFVQGGTKLEDIPNEVNGKIVLFERGTTVTDYNKQVENAVTSMGKEVILGAIAATLIILIFLRNFRTTLIAVVSIPLSILLTLFLLHQSNITLNILTLGGLAVAVGRLVDDSIVVIENIFRRLQKDSFSKDIILDATKEVAVAITSSTLTTVAVFLPIGLVSGAIGKLMLPMVLAVVYYIL